MEELGAGGGTALPSDALFHCAHGEDRGLNSPAGPALTSAWTGLRDAVQVSPRPAGQRAF